MCCISLLETFYRWGCRGPEAVLGFLMPNHKMVWSVSKLIESCHQNQVRPHIHFIIILSTVASLAWHAVNSSCSRHHTDYNRICMRYFTCHRIVYLLYQNPIQVALSSPSLQSASSSQTKKLRSKWLYLLLISNEHYHHKLKTLDSYGFIFPILAISITITNLTLCADRNPLAGVWGGS